MTLSSVVPPPSFATRPPVVLDERSVTARPLSGYCHDDDERETNPGIATVPAVAHRDRPVLTVLTGVFAGKVFPLETRDAIVGRSRDCAVRVDEPGVSRQHVRIVQTLDDRFFLEDLGSRNGTFLGGQPVRRTEVTSGDRIQIGPNLVVRFSLMDSAEEALARQLYEASTSDALTQVANRRYFEDRLAAELAYGQRHGTEVSVLVLDLDHFKRINDTFGHAAGDVVLRVVAAQVKKTLRVEDLLARHGGEEFVVLSRAIGRDGIAALGERIRQAVARLQIPWKATSIKLTVSIGAALLSDCAGELRPSNASLPPRGEESDLAERLVELADARLYQAKESGRNRVVVR